MKLFKVQLEYTVMVLAKNEEKAEQKAIYNVDKGTPDLCIATTVKNKKDLPQEWADCYPFGGKFDKTCEEILNEK